MDADWDRRHPLPIGSRLAMVAELFGGFAALIVVSALLARWTA